MAYAMRPHALPRWVVGTDTEPTDREIFLRRTAWADAHRSELGLGFLGLMVEGHRLPRDLFPEKATIKSKTINPPDMLTISGAAFSERLRDIVEKIEPDRHQWVEVATYLRDGAPTPMRYFCVVITQIADNQIDAAGTTVRRNERGKAHPPDSPVFGVLTIDRAQTADWHLWISRDLYDATTISNELHHKIVEAKIPGIKFNELLERTS